MTHRFRVEPGTRAILEYSGSDSRFPVTLVDFSANGAGLLVPQAPRVGECVLLTIHGSAEATQFSGVLRWAEPTEEGWWRTGCQFSQGIGQTPGFCESRSRKPCNVPVVIRVQGDGLTLADARVVDHSRGGVRVRVHRPLAPGASILFGSPDGTTSFVARVQWSSAKDGQCEAGCQFQRAADLQAFRGLLPKTVTAAPKQDRTPRASNRGAWAACAFVYTWSVLYSCGLWPP